MWNQYGSKIKFNEFHRYSFLHFSHFYGGFSASNIFWIYFRLSTSIFGIILAGHLSIFLSICLSIFFITILIFLSFSFIYFAIVFQEFYNYYIAKSEIESLDEDLINKNQTKWQIYCAVLKKVINYNYNYQS